MYRKLLITLDGSELSEAILPYARLLARKLHLPVEMLRVIEPEVIAAAATRRTHRDAEQDLRTSSTNYLNGVAACFADTVQVNCFTLVGDPATTIIEKAAAEDGTLLAMSTRGRSGIQRWYLGSVADKVLHGGSTPTLMIKGSGQPQPREREATINRIIVPVDGSALAEQALPHAKAVSQALGARIDLLRVYSLLTTASYGVGYMPDFEEIADTLVQEVREYLAAHVATFESEGVKHGDGIIEEGDPAAKIIDLAQETPNSMIVMCSHGRSGIGRWVLGGTADRVVRHSGDPVLVMRGTE